MLKKGTFIKRTFNKLFILNLFSYATGVMNYVIDAMVGGYRLGDNALCAISVVSPLYEVIRFLIALFIPGLVMLYGRYIYASDKEKAHETAGKCFLIAIITSIFIIALLYTGKNIFLDFFNCAGQIKTYASSYYYWVIIYGALYPFYFVLYYLINIDGDAKIVAISLVLSTIVKIVLSNILSVKMGIAGVGISACLFVLLNILILSLHFFKKSNTIAFKFCFNTSDIGKAFVLSSGTFLDPILTASLGLAMNTIIIRFCGINYVAIYSIIVFMLSVFNTFGAIYESCSGLCNGFMVEQNYIGVKTLLKQATFVTFIMGTILMIGFYFGASFVPALYGIGKGEMLNYAIEAVKLMAVFSIFQGLSSLGFGVYVYIDRPALSVLLSLFSQFLCPLILSFILVMPLGFSGVSIGVAVAPIMSLLLVCVIGKIMYRDKKFPLYLDENKVETISFDLEVSHKSIVELRDMIFDSIKEHGYSTSRICLILEELYLRIYDKNPGKKIISECTLNYTEDNLYVFIRDSGVVFNYMDEDNLIDSFNAYVLNNLIANTRNKNYSITTSFNRNAFVFGAETRKHNKLKINN